jgi:hypothetical protein
MRFMWNWKLIYENETFNLFCDTESVAGSEENEEGMFPSVECYHSLPDKVAAWVSIGIKDKEFVKDYIGQRQEAGLPIEGYEDFSYTLGIAELDAPNKLYRVIPAMDLDVRDQQIGTSSLLDRKKGLSIKGMKSDWSKVDSPRTSKAIKKLFHFFYRSDSQMD